jgi:N-acetyltransferase
VIRLIVGAGTEAVHIENSSRCTGIDSIRAWAGDHLAQAADMPVAFDPKPALLEGHAVRLEPLTVQHADALFVASQDPEIWRWMPMSMFASVSETKRWIEDALGLQANGDAVAFATIRKSDGVAIGSTRYLDIRRPHRALEIGFTWLAREAQRTAINTEAKFLMLQHAFESLGAIRVQLKTDERNEKSRNAIARLGAVFEGILRNYQTRAHDGYVRNTAMFSITEPEWPAVKVRLTAMLARRK